MVSEGSELEVIPSFISTPTKIRSRYRRRLLNRLSEGGATVTTLARDIGLQIPHASAELRKLRNEELKGKKGKNVVFHRYQKYNLRVEFFSL